MNYHRPANLDEARRALAEPGARALAGGTDLMVGMGHAAPWPAALVDLKSLPELQGLERNNGVLRIGAATTLSELRESPHVESFPALAKACRHFAARQIRNRATLGGNIVNASPAADLVPPLIAHEAVCVSDHRRIPLVEFTTGPGRTVLEPGEILVAVEIPIPPKDGRAFFVKHAPREAMAIAVVNLAGFFVLREGRVALARIALGSVAPTVIRARRCEVLLEGEPLGDSVIAEAVRAAVEEAAPIDDIRATARYRNLMIARLLRWELSNLGKRTR